jgi:hypothetical protein
MAESGECGEDRMQAADSGWSVTVHGYGTTAPRKGRVAVDKSLDSRRCGDPGAAMAAGICSQNVTTIRLAEQLAEPPDRCVGGDRHACR